MILYCFTVTDTFSYPFKQIWEKAQLTADTEAAYRTDIGDIWPAFRVLLVGYRQSVNYETYEFEVHTV